MQLPAPLRTAAAAAVAAAVVFTATGCNLITPQATTIEYNPSHGVSGKSGSVEFHNAMLIGEPKGAYRSLAVTFTNEGETTFVQVRVGEKSENIRVPGGVSVYGIDKQLIFPATSTLTGGLQNVSFQAEGAAPAGLRVPVMSTDYPGNEKLGPRPTPTAAPQPASTPAETPAP